MSGAHGLAVRILLGAYAALWAVLVPGQAATLTDRPLSCPRWLRQPRAAAPRVDALPPLDVA